MSVVQPGRATGAVADIYAQVERDFGLLAPPIALHSAAPGPLAASWMMLRESLVAHGTVGRLVKERVSASVSASNSCPYCVEVHNAASDGLARLRTRWGDDRVSPDIELDRLVEWVSGRPGATPAAVLAAFDREQLAELVGVAVTFHYLNRMVNVFLESSPIPVEVPGRARSGARRVLRRFMGVAAYAKRERGESTRFLPSAPLAPDMNWAQASVHVANAFARSAAALDAVAVPVAVRELVSETLAGWDGSPPGLGRSWADRRASDLPEELRPAGRLALLTAMASYQVSDKDIADFRRYAEEDRQIIEVTSWASMSAARLLGGRLLPG